MTNKSSNLSQRAIQSLNVPNPMRDALMDAWDYIFHPVNPVINLGVAQNDLMNDELNEKVDYTWVCVMMLAIKHYAPF